ncbi:MAG: fumarylacetoacetase [Gemmatimonadaceae bacterium]
MTALDATHDQTLRSWVESANEPTTDFPIQNLPFGVFARDGRATVGVAIGDQILDVSACLDAGLLPASVRATAEACRDTLLNRLMALGREPARALRAAISVLLSHGSPAAGSASSILVPMKDVAMEMPAHVGDYSDFYASLYHATNVGSMFRPDNPLLPNYKWIPIGYHGRASSIVVSGTEVHRPIGQTRDGNDGAPVVGQTKRLDYELELGVFVGRGNARGSTIAIGEAEDHMFGVCLLNDWSARDIQAWEYQPLGPFLAKSFVTTISPWVVTFDALAPFRAPAFQRAPEEPAPLPYLESLENANAGGLNVTLEVLLTSEKMRAAGETPVQVSKGSFTDMYWTLAQLVTHHASNGCDLRAGDLLGSGTVSGSTKESRGCLLERTWRGSEPIELPGGETRAFLADGDEVTLRGYCERDGYRRIGLGQCVGRVVAR